MTNYSPNELLICVAARMFEDARTCFVGTGIPMLAASLAQRLYAPNLVAVFEFGGTGAQLEELPIAVGGMRTFHKAAAATGICDVMETAQRGFIDYGFIGGAQIDPYGNLNSTVIGDYDAPKVRLPGSGGGNDVGSLCWQTIALMKHDKRRFVPKVDFITTPGYLSGPGARERAGLPANSGPLAVISTLCTMTFETETCLMQVKSLHPGVTVDQVVENTGFDIGLAPDMDQNQPPTDEELYQLRHEIDPTRLYI
ncbi:MAG: CoA-transferase [Chloroflexota bacterium]